MRGQIFTADGDHTVGNMDGGSNSNVADSGTSHRHITTRVGGAQSGRGDRSINVDHNHAVNADPTAAYINAQTGQPIASQVRMGANGSNALVSVGGTEMQLSTAIQLGLVRPADQGQPQNPQSQPQQPQVQTQATQDAPETAGGAMAQLQTLDTSISEQVASSLSDDIKHEMETEHMSSDDIILNVADALNTAADMDGVTDVLVEFGDVVGEDNAQNIVQSVADQYTKLATEIAGIHGIPMADVVAAETRDPNGAIRVGLAMMRGDVRSLEAWVTGARR